MNNIVIVGGGIAGYTAALELVSKENNVTLIEKGQLGGACLNIGCIPYKILDQLNSVHDFKDASVQKNKITDNLRSSLKALISAKKIEYVNDEARLITERSVLLINSNKTLSFDILILATGAKPIISKEFKDENVLTYQDVLSEVKAPQDLVVVGGGFIGIEIARLYQSMGSNVILIEKEATILNSFPQGASDIAMQKLKGKGIDVQTGVEVLQIKNKKIICSDNKSFSFEKAVLCIGRIANIIDSDIELTIQDNRISTDECFRTNLKNVYAIGDCTEGVLLANKAAHDARILSRNILSSSNVSRNYLAIPLCTRVGDISIAAVGRCDGLHKSRMNFANIGNSYTDDSGEGFVEIYYDNEKRIVGGFVVNKNAGEVIAALTPIVYGKMTASDVGDMVWVHPTAAEIIKEAVRKII